jgi:hypothetical protein
LWIIEVPHSSSVSIGGKWEKNEGKFEHSLGGAVMIQWIRGEVKVRGQYKGMRALSLGCLCWGVC